VVTPGARAERPAGVSEPISAEAIVDRLRSVADPEIPNVSVVDLGMIGRVDVDDADSAESGVRVELLPTFVGCPALEVIREEVAAALAVFGRPVRVDVSMATPWSSDRITPLGRERLRRSGFAPPAPGGAGEGPAAVACPFCGSDRVAMDSLFGPTQCRSLYYCRACRQPFEAFKAV
jgi:ring-1,2-phenylacetyl-CoA epoxidase subunit PaaD